MNLDTRGIYFHPFVRPPVLWVPPLAGGFFFLICPPHSYLHYPLTAQEMVAGFHQNGRGSG
jgi:hypothetical protein